MAGVTGGPGEAGVLAAGFFGVMDGSWANGSSLTTLAAVAACGSAYPHLCPACCPGSRPACWIVLGPCWNTLSQWQLHSDGTHILQLVWCHYGCLARSTHCGCHTYL